MLSLNVVLVLAVALYHTDVVLKSMTATLAAAEGSTTTADAHPPVPGTRATSSSTSSDAFCNSLRSVVLGIFGLPASTHTWEKTSKLHERGEDGNTFTWLATKLATAPPSVELRE